MSTFGVNYWASQIWGYWALGLLESLCHSNGHIENMPAREIKPLTALTGIWSQFLQTQWWAIMSEWTRLRLRPLSHRGWLLGTSLCDYFPVLLCNTSTPPPPPPPPIVLSISAWYTHISQPQINLFKYIVTYDIIFNQAHC